MEELVKSQWKCTLLVLFDRNHAVSHRNPSGGLTDCTRRESPSKIPREGLPVTKNFIGSVSALPLGLPAGTREGVKSKHAQKFIRIRQTCQKPSEICFLLKHIEDCCDSF